MSEQKGDDIECPFCLRRVLLLCDDGRHSIAAMNASGEREHAAARPAPADALRQAAQMALGVFQNFNLPKGEPQKCADTARDALIAALKRHSAARAHCRRD